MSTATPARNAPCPCGSGRKYKLCCLGKDGSPEDRRPWWPPRPDVATEPFAHRRRGGGVADKLAEFCQPLIDAAGPDEERLNKALAVGTICWNIAQVAHDDAEREQMIEDAVATVPDPEGQEDFRNVILDMLERYRTMYG